MSTKTALVLLALVLRAGRWARSHPSAGGQHGLRRRVLDLPFAHRPIRCGLRCRDRQQGIHLRFGEHERQELPHHRRSVPTRPQGRGGCLRGQVHTEGTIVFATLIGGTKREHHTGLAVDNDGYVYLVGGTHSADFPVTAGACDTSFNGEKDWGGDVYVTKINPSGSGLVFSTFLEEVLRRRHGHCPRSSTATSSSRGRHCSPDFPVTGGTISRRGAGQDAFLAKFSARWQQTDVLFPDRRQ